MKYGWIYVLGTRYTLWLRVLSVYLMGIPAYMASV